MHTCTKQSDFIYSLLLHYYYFELLSFNLHCKNLKLKTKSYSLVILHANEKVFQSLSEIWLFEIQIFIFYLSVHHKSVFLNSIVL